MMPMRESCGELAMDALRLFAVELEGRVQRLDGALHVRHGDVAGDLDRRGRDYLGLDPELTQNFEGLGGDAGMGHFFYPHPVPVTETQRHSAYPGCYALSKVLEEVMLEQYTIQYDLNGCCLRAPWIMEKDDFKYQLSFGEDVFGGPRWRDLVGAAQADEYVRTQTIPVMLDPAGQPVKRNFVHVVDLVSAMLLALDQPRARQQTFNICMDEPVDYAQVASMQMLKVCRAALGLSRAQRMALTRSST